MKPIITACSHEVELFSVRTKNKIVRNLINILKPRIEDFDAIAITGYSSSMISPIIAYKLKKNIVLVRKESEERISSYQTEGIHNQRCIFIDDCIATGDTFMRINKGLKLIKCTLVGFILYNDGGYMNGQLYKKIPSWGNATI